MLAALSRLCSRDDDYTARDCVGDCEKNCHCCVIDSEHRSERFCALTTVDPNGIDYCDCGRADEDQMELPQVRQRRQIERWIRKLFFAGIFMWGLIGVFAIINPTAIMFNVVVDEEYRAHLEEGKLMKESALEQQARAEEKRKEEELGSRDITNFLNEMLRSDKASEKDRIAIMHVLELASAKVTAAHCEAVVITAPIKVYGTACLFYALLCMALLTEDIPMRTSVSTAHLMWHALGIIGYALATTGHGRTMESSTFTFLMLGANIIMAVAWFIVRERIMRYNTTATVPSVDLAIKPS